MRNSGKNNSELDLCDGGSLSPTIFISDTKLSVYHISCFISVCPFVALSKAKFAKNVQIILSSPYYKAFIFKLLYVSICLLYQALLISLTVCVLLIFMFPE